MTDREAFYQLENFLIGLMGALGDDNLSPCKITLAEKMSDAVEQAQSALKEREERKKRCMWCYRAGRTPKNWKVTLIGGSGSAAEGELFEFDTANCCPMCGKPLKEDG